MVASWRPCGEQHVWQRRAPSLRPPLPPLPQMPAKKKGKGKKGKDEAPPPEPSEFDDMTIDALRAQIAELKPRLDRAQMDRNQVQLDRVSAQGLQAPPGCLHPAPTLYVCPSACFHVCVDTTAWDRVQCVWCASPARPQRPPACRAAHPTHGATLCTPAGCAGLRAPCARPAQDTLQTFYDITRREVSDFELKVMAKDRDMEVCEDNHRVEVRVYSQKVKHLEYEHSVTLKSIEGESKALVTDEAGEHGYRESTMRSAKDALKMERREKEFEHAMEIQETKLVRTDAAMRRARGVFYCWQ
jgi:hypothetical protein